MRASCAGTLPKASSDVRIDRCDRAPPDDGDAVGRKLLDDCLVALLQRGEETVELPHARRRNAACRELSSLSGSRGRPWASSSLRQLHRPAKGAACAPPSGRTSRIGNQRRPHHAMPASADDAPGTPRRAQTDPPNCCGWRLTLVSVSKSLASCGHKRAEPRLQRAYCAPLRPKLRCHIALGFDSMPPAGKFRQNRIRPSPYASTRASPPWISMMAETMARPRPLDSVGRLREASPR